MAKENKGQAKKDAERDMKSEGLFQTPKCRHTNRGSSGPVDNGSGQKVTKHWCSDCGANLGES